MVLDYRLMNEINILNIFRYILNAEETTATQTLRIILINKCRGYEKNRKPPLEYHKNNHCWQNPLMVAEISWCTINERQNICIVSKCIL